MTETGINGALAQVKREFAGVFGVSCFVNLLALTTSVYMLQVFDRVLSSQSYETLGYLTIIAIAAIAVLALMELARKRILARAGHWFEAAISPHVVAAVGEDAARGKRSTATLNDVSDVRSFVSGDGVTAFFDAPWLPIFLAVLFVLHPWLGVLASLGAVALFLCALANDLTTRRHAGESREEAAGARAAARELQDNAEILKAMGMRGTAFQRWRSRQETALPKTLKMLDAGAGITSLSRFIRLALQVGILGAGAYLVLQQQLTPGGMIAGSIILARALAPVEKSIQGWRGYQGARAGLANLKTLIGRDQQLARQQLPTPNGALDVEEVTHAPNGPEAPILRAISFKLDPGSVLGIAGPSGSGKSTLCRLLVGAQPPTSGHVRLDGADVFENIEQLGASIGYMPQDTAFLSGTVAENIARLEPDNQELVIEAAQRAGVHELILSLPEGYETDMGKLGPKLSGGQRQRLALARAFYSDPAFLVLDEPNSHLDQAGETALVTAIEQASKRGNTVVVVSHRSALLRVCDTLMVMQAGQIARMGPRAEIMALYAARREDTAGATGTAE